MNRSRVSILFLSLLLPVTPMAASGETKDAPPVALELWDSPRFHKSVVGDYGVKSDIEPGIDETVRTNLIKVRDLLAPPPPLTEVSETDGAGGDNEEDEDRGEKKRSKRQKKRDAAEAEAQRAAVPDPDAAIALLEQLQQELEADPEQQPHPTYDYTLGQVLLQQNRLDEAVEAYRSALDRFPSFLRAHKNLALVLVRQGEFKEAIPHLSEVIRLGGAEGTTYGLMGYAYSSTQEYVAAESAYRNAVLLQPDTLDWKLGLTQAVLRQRKYPEAVALFDELIRRYPDRSDFWLLQANAYIGMNRPLEAAENYEVVKRLGKATVASLNTLGDIYVNAELIDLAVEAYGGALELGGSSIAGQTLRRVEALAQRGALTQADQLLKKLKSGDADLAGADRKKLLKLEARLAVADGQGDEVVGVLQEIVSLDPLDGEALMLLGQHFARVDQIEQAIFYYERAESIEDFEADASVRHAQLLVTQSRYDEAVPLLKRAQEIDPRRDVADYLEQVERVAKGRR